MTSEERREVRYWRRKTAREKKKIQRMREVGDFEKVFSYKNLYESGLICTKSVGWKCSTQAYRANLVLNTNRTRKALDNNTFKSKGFFEFDLIERGKLRHIRSVHISERVVQRTLCDKVLIPLISPALIYDNGASLKNKGITFAINRLKCHLSRHFRKHGNKGYILTYDFSNYFDTANHKQVKREISKRVLDERLQKLTWMFIDAFGSIGLGLGSQVSQIAAIALPNKLDHYIKQNLQIKGYARYMDDGYLIHENKEHLKKCLIKMTEICSELGIKLNPKKVKIKKLSEGFDFLKVKFKLLHTGKIIMRMNKESVKTMHRKLKKFAKWCSEGRVVTINGKEEKKEFALSDACSAYASWRAHMKRGNNYWRIYRMDGYFEKLFGVNPKDKEAWKAIANGGYVNVQN